MDIRVAITKAGIFLAVYTLVLGAPFVIGAYYTHNWIIPTSLAIVLATIGPHIYSYLKAQAEERLLFEQKQYQRTLKQASMGMTSIRDMEKLLGLITHIISKSVKINYCAVYLHDAENKMFRLCNVRGWQKDSSGVKSLSEEDPIIGYIKKQSEPVLFEDLKQKGFIHDPEYQKDLVTGMMSLRAEVVIPCMLKDMPLAFIVMGQKKNQTIYTSEDLVVFSILSGQVALAIENAQFHENAVRTQERLLKADKMATIGTMADGLSHQMNNRLHAMGMIVGDSLDTVQKKLQQNDFNEWKETLNDIEYSLTRLNENIRRGGEIVHGLLKYTRKGSTAFEAVDFDLLFKATLEMLQYKIKLNQVYMERVIEKDAPKIWGNFTQLQEVFFNLIDNAYDAMMERKDTLKEEGFSPELNIVVSKHDEGVLIVVKDNGIGVKEKDMYKLFTPFFTTKATSQKGTGLGLYVMRQLIEESHGGKIYFASEYAQGSEVKIILPSPESKLKNSNVALESKDEAGEKLTSVPQVNLPLENKEKSVEVKEEKNG